MVTIPPDPTPPGNRAGTSAAPPQPPRSVLVGTDFTPAAKLAFRHAVALAHTAGSTLHLLHVAHCPHTRSVFGIAPGARSMAALEDRIRQRNARRFHDFLRGEAVQGIYLHCELRVGIPHRELLDYADQCGADLIVVGERPENRWQHLLQHILFESVGEKVRREALCGVLTVPYRPRRAALSGSSSSTP